MSLFDWLTKRPKTNDALVVAVQENSRRLESVAQALNDRESPAMLREAILTGLKDRTLEKALGSACERVDLLTGVLRDSGARPIPVQTFPLQDDLRFEKEKQALGCDAARRFVEAGNAFAQKLAEAHTPVGKAMEKFFTLMDAATKATGTKEKADFAGALESLMYCSPKRIVASFQQRALEAGWVLVSLHNELIDALAAAYPRCRAGIYASRLTYADVIQISEEILSTLRASSTLLEDAQRRHDLLEALQGEMLRDIETPEMKMIWNAICQSCQSIFQLGEKEEDGFFAGLLKKTGSASLAVVVGAMGTMAVPSAQFQGHLAREHRLRAFIATSVLLNQVWTEWSRVNEAVVIPHLQVMFRLKADYIANKMVCLCDLLSANGYSLVDLSANRLLAERKK